MSPGLARPRWCCTRAMAAMALTTAAPMSCSRMSSHCVAAPAANWHLRFSSRSLWFSSSNLGGARRGMRPQHRYMDPRTDPCRPPPADLGFPGAEETAVGGPQGTEGPSSAGLPHPVFCFLTLCPGHLQAPPRPTLLRDLGLPFLLGSFCPHPQTSHTCRWPPRPGAQGGRPGCRPGGHRGATG